MHGSVNVNSRLILTAARTILLSILGSFLITVGVSAQSASTTVSATICAVSSEISIVTPVSDSIVTDSVVPITGSIYQTSQIEVYVDGGFDSILPIDDGQQSFSGTVHLSQGTHTIRLVAISTCSGANGEASSVVTYGVPPQAVPSDGNTIQTQAGSQVDGGVSVESTTKDAIAPGTNPGLIESILVTPLKQAAMWLNIGKVDSQPAEVSSMSPIRAASIGMGMWLTTFGAAGFIVQAAAASPIGVSVASSFASTTSLPSRVRLFSRGSRILGILLLGGALFL